MGITDRTLRTVVSGVRAHPKAVIAGAGSAVAGVLAVVMGRRAETLPELPDPGTLAGATAASVYNAAKGAVIAAVREADEPTRETALEAVRRAIVEAAAAGADVTAAALGGVDGAVAIAGDLDVPAVPLAREAAEAARVAAGGVGPAAAVRIRDALAPLLDA